MAIREEIRLLSNADAVAAAGLLPSQSVQKASATGIEKVSSVKLLLKSDSFYTLTNLLSPCVVAPFATFKYLHAVFEAEQNHLAYTLPTGFLYHQSSARASAFLVEPCHLGISQTPRVCSSL